MGVQNYLIGRSVGSRWTKASSKLIQSLAFLGREGVEGSRNPAESRPVLSKPLKAIKVRAVCGFG